MKVVWRCRLIRRMSSFCSSTLPVQLQSCRCTSSTTGNSSGTVCPRLQASSSQSVRPFGSNHIQMLQPCIPADTFSYLSDHWQQ